MKQIKTKKELNKVLFSDRYNSCFKIGGYETPSYSDIIERAINREDYILKKYSKERVYVDCDIDMPNLDDIMSEMVGYIYIIPEEAEVEFKSMMKGLLDKYNIKKSYLDRVEYVLVEEYDIEPLIKKILEHRVSKIEKTTKLLKNYKEKLEKII